MSPLFYQNRSKLDEQLSNHRGEWVAFSQDGRRIVATAPSLAELERTLIAGGKETPSDVVVELIPIDPDDIYLGAGELS